MPVAARASIRSAEKPSSSPSTRRVSCPTRWPAWRTAPGVSDSRGTTAAVEHLLVEIEFDGVWGIGETGGFDTGHRRHETADLEAELQALRPQLQRLALVGHEPELGALAAHLIGAPEGAIGLKKAGIALLLLGPGRGQLKLLMAPRQLLGTQ